MRTKTIVLLFVAAFLQLGLMAEKVNIEKARRVAKNFYFEKTGITQEKISFEAEYSVLTGNAEPAYYIFDLEQGFVIVSGEDRVRPLLGYSTKNSYSPESNNPGFNFWVNQYRDEIQYIRENNLDAYPETPVMWQKYTMAFDEFNFRSAKAVDALLGAIEWDQSAGWNAYCPAASGGPGGHVYAGCVATAMGMVMRYWNAPYQGTGSHSYNHYLYGTQSANFGATQYEFPLMDPNTATDAAALLIYHCAVSVDMDFGVDGSGAYSTDVPYALETYFGYDNDATHKYKSSYPAATWIQMLKDNIDEARPLYYSGQGPDGGHAFVCDGYDDSDMFHFNWGWSGYENGYFALTDLTPGSNNFNSSQAAVFDIYPATTYAAVQNLEYSMDFNDLNITWDAPVVKDGKALASFDIYKNYEFVTSLSSSTFSYTENNLANGNYDYSVVAVYSSPNGYASTDATSSITVFNNYQVQFTVTDQNSAPVQGATCKLKVGIFYLQANTDANGQATISTTEMGRMRCEVIKSGCTSYSDSVDVYDPVNPVIANITGIDEIKTIAFNAFPNPASEYVNLQIDESIKEIVVYDVAGKVVYTQILSESKNQFILNVKEYNSGIYYIKLIGENNVFMSNIMVK